VIGAQGADHHHRYERDPLGDRGHGTQRRQRLHAVVRKAVDQPEAGKRPGLGASSPLEDEVRVAPGYGAGQANAEAHCALRWFGGKNS
jgi:hypothetical protein